MKNLKEIKIARNQISCIISQEERPESVEIMQKEFQWLDNHQPMAVFRNLVSLDLSSNLLTALPPELYVLKLEELNLMNN